MKDKIFGVLQRVGRSFMPETKFITGKAALSALRDVLPALRYLIEPLRIIGSFHTGHRVFCRKILHKPCLLRRTHMILLGRINIRIIIKHRHIKMLRQTLNAVRTTGCTTTVKQEPWHFFSLLSLPDHFFHDSLIIYPIHISMPNPPFIHNKGACKQTPSHIRKTQYSSFGSSLMPNI